MDANDVVGRLRASRERLREVMMAGQPGYENADVFPRSATMRFLLDPAKRGIAATALGAIASFAMGRRRRKRRAATRRGLGIAALLLGLLNSRRR